MGFFYPFGMRMGGLSSPISGTENRYRYNGKELHTELNLNWYDYGARMYDPSIGRWNGVDAMAESYQAWSSYNYTLNNPIRFIDPDGNVVGDIYNLNGVWIGSDGQEDRSSLSFRNDK